MDLKNAVILERYKYILARKQSLNEATFKIAAIYQALMLGVAVAQYNVLLSAHEKKISSDLSLFSTYCLVAIFIIISVFVFSLLCGGVFAWLKYKRDEDGVELKVFGVCRPKVRVLSLFTWYETYFALVVFLIGLGGVYMYVRCIIPEA